MRGLAHRQLLEIVHRRSALLSTTGPVVSFAFDDFPRSAYTAGGAILKRLEVRGTFYAAMGLMHSTNALGDQFRLDDLHGVVADGHELASHTFQHVSSRATPLGAFVDEVRKGRKALQEVRGLTVSDNFAFPLGAVTAAAKQAVGKEMKSCRGIFGGLNTRRADLNLLRANSLYGGMDQLELVGRLLEKNERRQGWLIFYTHDVRENPSPYGCTPRLFESAVTMALKKSMTILTVDQVMAGKVEKLPLPRPRTVDADFKSSFGT